MVESNDLPPLRAEWNIPIIIDREYELVAASITVNGQLND